MQLSITKLLPGDLVADLPGTPMGFIVDKRESSFSACVCIQVFKFQTKKLEWVDFHMSHVGTILSRLKDE